MEGFEARQLQSIFESATDAIIIADHLGTILSWNPAAERIFEWEQAEIVGKPLTAIMPSSYSSMHEAGMKRFNATGEKRAIGKTVVLEGLTKSGKIFPIELSLGHWKANQQNFFCGIIRDITVRKRMEAEILKAQQELELKVVERTNELTHRNAELEQYAYVVSHDLKEPVRSIAGLISLLRLPGTEEEKDKYLQLIQHSTSRMIKLVDDLLEHSRIGVNRYVSTIDLNTLLKEVITDLQKTIVESNAEITYDSLPTIQGYRTELRLLFQNLISNAIKFRKPHTKPIISIQATNDNVHWKFSVKDNGIGIETENLEQVFIIFKRLHERSAYEGTGIGLTHCKKIAELHGGKIWGESVSGEGSTFHFTLPLLISPQEKFN